MELALCHPSSTWNSVVAPRVLKSLYPSINRFATPVRTSNALLWITCLDVAQEQQELIHLSPSTFPPTAIKRR
jgi:ABC-type amino acid transport system permease subunit